MVGGEVIGSQHHQPSGSNLFGISVLLGRIQLTSPIQCKFQYLQNSSKDTAQSIIYSPCCYSQVPSVMSASMRPHRRQPTRLPHPQDSPGKNTGVGCHFLLQSLKVKNESEVAQSHPTLSYPMDCSLPGSSLHGIFQARVLEWGAIAFFL